MNNECPKCKEYAADGSAYCGSCGRALRDSGQDGLAAVKEDLSESSKHGVSSTILQAACAVLILVAVFDLIVLLAKSGDVLFLLENATLTFFFLLPSPETVFNIGLLGPQLYWIFIVIVILGSAVFATWKFITETENNGGIARPGASENTAIFWVCVSFGASLAINFAAGLIVQMTGDDMTVPDFGDIANQVFSFANAAVWEEIVTRLLYIGGPMVIISLIITKKIDSLKCLLGGFGMSGTAILFIIISGMIFGMAHYSGWDGQAWKVVTTGIMGMLLGYVFVRFGLYASILLHFINNFMSSFSWVGAGALGVIVLLMFIGFGTVALYYILKRVLGSAESIREIPLFRNEYIK